MTAPEVAPPCPSCGVIGNVTHCGRADKRYYCVNVVECNRMYYSQAEADEAKAKRECRTIR